MNRYSHVWLLCFLSAVLAPSVTRADASPPVAPAAAATSDDPTRKLYEDGTAALNAGKFAEAEGLLRRAWKQKTSYDIAANLGAALLEQGKHAEAAHYLNVALASFPAGGKPSVKKGIEDLLSRAKGQVATLHVTVNVEGAEVWIGGELKGKSPLADDVFAEPGQLNVEAKMDGHETAAQKIDAKKGEAREVTLTLAAKQAVTGGEGKSLAPVIGLGAGAVVAAGVGIGFMAAWAGQRDRVQQVSNDIHTKGNSCVSGAANFDPRCPALESDARGAVPLSRVGIGALIGAGLLGAGAAAYWLWPRAASVQRGMEILPVASAEGGAVMILGSF